MLSTRIYFSLKRVQIACYLLKIDFIIHYSAYYITFFTNLIFRIMATAAALRPMVAELQKADKCGDFDRALKVADKS